MDMSEGKKFVVRCRGIIQNDGKLLVVKHPHDTSYAALPGGHLEIGEDLKDGLRREVVEELGIQPIVGRLLYVHNFIAAGGAHSIEFFFEVTNGADFKECEKLIRSHADELAEIYWADPSDDIRILPEQLAEDFKKGALIANETRYIRG